MLIGKKLNPLYLSQYKVYKTMATFVKMCGWFMLALGIYTAYDVMVLGSSTISLYVAIDNIGKGLASLLGAYILAGILQAITCIIDMRNIQALQYNRNIKDSK